MIALPAQVTFATASRVMDDVVRAAQAALRAHAAPGAAPVAVPGQPTGPAASGVLDVDLAGCQTYDSSLLAVLLELARQAAAASAHCRVHRAPPNLRKLASLYGADALLFAPSDASSVQPA